MDHKNTKLELLVKEYYDVQDLRIRSSNRIVSLDDKEFLESYHQDVMSNLRGMESELKKKIMKELKNYPIWNEWLKGLSGVGPCLAGGVISIIHDIQRFQTISKLWKYSGYSTDEEGKALKRAKGKKICWNPHLKKNLWKLGESFVKVGKGYRRIYDDTRAEYEKSHPKTSDGHRYAMSKRKVIKIFLSQLMHKWYELEGLEPPMPYVHQIKNHSNFIHPDEMN